MQLINAIEKPGSGSVRIRNALQNYPEIAFASKEFSGGVMITFAAHIERRGRLNSSVHPERGGWSVKGERFM